MNLYIQIKDGRPFEHPIIEENLKMAFPDIDLQNLPSSFARFIRVQPPPHGVYQVNEGCTYEFVDGVCQDVWRIRDMTDEEKLQTQNEAKQRWIDSGGPASWVFDEHSCQFFPPVQHPEDGKKYRWDEATTSWVETERGI